LRAVLVVVSSWIIAELAYLVMGVRMDTGARRAGRALQQRRGMVSGLSPGEVDSGIDGWTGGFGGRWHLRRGVRKSKEN
jgi:hypothetical protein